MNNNRIYYTIIMMLTLFYSIEANGQARTTLFKGAVKTELGFFVPYANVYITKLRQKTSVLASTQCNSRGEYQINLQNFQTDSVELHVTGINIEPFVLKCKNISQRIDIIVAERVQQMKDVVIKAPRITTQGDTINYRVSAFQQQNDLSIGQVLKRLPGITVSDIGQISYKGVPIKNFYIEGLDLMKGKYGIATNNIDPNSISTVQIMENHQDIKALKDLKPEERASINLKLKNGVKGIFNLIATLGLGYDDKRLWDNELIATYFKRNSQLLATYKGNNTGNDLENELRSFDDDGIRYKTSTLSEIETASTPNIGKRHYFFNKSHAGTVNYVSRIGSENELGFNFSLLNDRDERSTDYKSVTYLPDGTSNLVQQKTNSLTHQTVGYGTFTYMLNSKSRYLKDQIKAEFIHQDGSSSTQMAEFINQKSKMKNLYLNNSLHFTNRTAGNRGVDIFSKINFERRPHNLFASTNLFPQVVTGDDVFQDVVRSNLSTENRLDLLSAIVLGKLSIHPTAHLNFSKDKLTSVLQTYNNDLALNTIDAGIGITAFYKLNSTYCELFLTSAYRLYDLKNNQVDLTTDKHRFVVEPHLSIRYAINNNHELRLKSSLAYSSPAIENLYDNYILNSYRQLSIYQSHDLYQANVFATSLSYDYRNILSMWFAGLDMGFTHYSPNVLYGASYQGEKELIISRPTNEAADSYTVSLRSSKGWDWAKTKLSVNATYKHLDSPLLIQDQIVRYLSNSSYLSMSLYAMPLHWMAIDYLNSWYIIKSRMKLGSSVPTQNTFKSKLAFNFFMAKALSLNMNFAYYYNNRNEKDKSFILSNAEASYAIKRWNFTLVVDNLWNQKQYINSFSTELQENTTIYRIRPRSVLLKVRYRIF